MCSEGRWEFVCVGRGIMVAFGEVHDCFVNCYFFIFA